MNHFEMFRFRIRDSNQCKSHLLPPSHRAPISPRIPHVSSVDHTILPLAFGSASRKGVAVSLPTLPLGLRIT